MTSEIIIRDNGFITNQNYLFREPVIFDNSDELKEISGLDALIWYNGVPQHLKDKPISIPFTFSKQYEFLLDELHLITRFENDLDRIAMRNKAIGVVVINPIMKYNPYFSSVRAYVQLVLNNLDFEENQNVR